MATRCRIRGRGSVRSISHIMCLMNGAIFNISGQTLRISSDKGVWLLTIAARRQAVWRNLWVRAPSWAALKELRIRLSVTQLSMLRIRSRSLEFWPNRGCSGNS